MYPSFATTGRRLIGGKKSRNSGGQPTTRRRFAVATALLVAGVLLVLAAAAALLPRRNPFRGAALSDKGMDFWWMASLRANPESALALDFDATAPIRLLKFPPETKRVWIDVGVNKMSDFLVNLDEPDGADLFVLGYEPSAVWKPCPHPRCVVLWAAATPAHDVVEVNVQGGADLCNSLLRPNAGTKSKLWRGCVTQQTTKDGRPVTVHAPGVPLSEVVARIPPSVVVEYVKIDAQGYDLEVMKGALPESRRIQVVSLEAMDVEDRSKLLYQGQPTLSDINAILGRAGWTFVKSVGNRGARGEVNAFFVYQNAFADKVGHLADVLMSNKEGKGKNEKRVA
jgi:Methyltransferase FkbM domain